MTGCRGLADRYNRADRPRGCLGLMKLLLLIHQRLDRHRRAQGRQMQRAGRPAQKHWGGQRLDLLNACRFRYLSSRFLGGRAIAFKQHLPLRVTRGFSGTRLTPVPRQGKTKTSLQHLGPRRDAKLSRDCWGSMSKGPWATSKKFSLSFKRSPSGTS